ncbi:MAG: PilZ domain-containing protein [bacterium]
MTSLTHPVPPCVAVLGETVLGGVPLAEPLAKLGVEVRFLAGPDAAYEWLRGARRRMALLVVDSSHLDFDALGVLGWLKTKGLLGDRPVWLIEDAFEPTPVEICEGCGITRCVSRSSTAADLAAWIGEALFDVAQEKRRHPRVAVAAPVVLGLFEKKLEGLLTDLSLTGAFVETPAPFAVDTRVSLRFQLPGASVASAVRARVVRVNVAGSRGRHVQLREGMGLEFEPLAPLARAAITGYLARHGPAAKAPTLDEEAETEALDAPSEPPVPRDPPRSR